MNRYRMQAQCWMYFDVEAESKKDAIAQAKKLIEEFSFSEISVSLDDKDRGSVIYGPLNEDGDLSIADVEENIQT